MKRGHLGRSQVDAAIEEVKKQEIQSEKQNADDAGNAPPWHDHARMPARNVLAAPVRRQFAKCLGTDAAQRLIEIALNLLQRGNAAGRGPMDALKAEGQTSVLQLKHVIVEQRVLLQSRQLIEEAHATDALAEEAAQHAVLRPYVAVFCRDILDDVVGGGADEVFGRIGLSLGNAG